MKFSRTVAYAVQATLGLAQAGGDKPVPCSQLSAEGNLPERFLLQILRTLVTHDILRSTRGVEGGYRLSRPPADISLLEVIEAIDGKIAASIELNPEGSGRYQARLAAVLGQVTASTRRELANVSLSDLLGAKEGGKSTSP